VVESKYNLAFTNPFELKKGDDGKFLVSDKVLKKELSARGYKRFWLVGNFDDGESTIDFQNLLREVFQKNGLVSEDQIKFEM